MSHQPLRLESIGDFLQKLIAMYRRHLRLFATILIVPSLIAMALGLAMEGMLDEVAGISLIADPQERLLAMMPTMARFVLYVLVSAIIFGAQLGAMATAIAGIQAMRPAGALDAWRHTAGRLGGIMTIAGGFPLLILSGLLPLILPALLPEELRATSVIPLVLVLLLFLVPVWVIGVPLFLVRYLLAIPALLDERTGVVPACRRSAALTKGSRLFLVIVILIAGLAANVVAVVFQGPFIAGRWLAGEGGLSTLLLLAQGIAGGIGGALGLPFPLLALCLLYSELKSREQTITIGV